MAIVSNPIELMTGLGLEYRRIRTDHQRESPNGTTRRRIEQRLAKIGERFEGLLAHWVHDPKQSDAWREFFYHEAERPDAPILATPPAFRGETDTGAVVEIQETDYGYDIMVDGARADRREVPWQLGHDRHDPVVIGDLSCHETFAASDDAVAALKSFLDQSGAQPPWDWAHALYDDGLIDADFGLTPRGARRIQSARVATTRATKPAPTAWTTTHYCVIVANASRARIFSLETEGTRGEPAMEPLIEVADCTNPLARARDSEQFSDTRPGLRREGQHGPRHGVSDRRDHHRSDDLRQHVQHVADIAARVFGSFHTGRVIIVASPQLLAQLRPAIAEHIQGQSHLLVYEHAGDLTWQGTAAIHDALSAAELLPERGRQPPTRPMRTPNPWQGG